MSVTLSSSDTICKAVVHPEAEGDTLDELYSNLREAIACHLDLDTDEVRVSNQPARTMS